MNGAMAGSIQQALLDARDQDGQMEFLDFDHMPAEGLDLSELTCKQVTFHACRFCLCVIKKQ